MTHQALSSPARPTPACAGITWSASRSRHGAGPTPACAGITARLRSVRMRGPTPACAGITRPAPREWRGRGPTPACAGITACVVAARHRRAAYPRVRGDHLRPHPAGRPMQAYPRVRGDHALAGTTSPPDVAAYPRVRGDHSHGPSIDRSRATAYPRVRGDHAVTRLRVRHPDAGGLPPRARGSPCPRSRSRAGAGLPPRARGSRDAAPERYSSGLGLPPRARGSLSPCRSSTSCECWPTPACAGITDPSARHASPAAGLPPRARGSRVTDDAMRQGQAYPRVRGDHAPDRTARPCTRPTPACAGITCVRRAAPG